MMTIVLAFARAYWKQIALAAAILLVIGWHKAQVNKAWYDGREALKLEQKKEAEKRDADANAADRRARECAGHPNCLLENDGFRRD